MQRILLIVFCLISIDSFAQGNCVDSLNPPDTYYRCADLSAAGEEYNPVCGCDNITYRNECAAAHWGGLLSWTSETICGNFHFDFRPTALDDTKPAKFQVFVKNFSNQSIPITLYIYKIDAWGVLQYAWYQSTNQNGIFPISPLEIPTQTFPRGIYAAVVIVGGEKQYIKFAKVVD